MKKLIFIGMLVLTAGACTKNTGSITTYTTHTQRANPVVPSSKLNNLVVGTYVYPHLSNNLPIYSFYFAAGGKLYNESQYFPMRPQLSNMTSQSRLMADSAYRIAQPLLANFPDYLLSNPNTYIGCSGSDSAQYMTNVICLATINGTDTVKWNINSDTTKLPIALRPYVGQVRTTMQALAKL